jgi:hypothetical protein
MLQGTRVGSGTVLSREEYVCWRCGRVGGCTSSRPKPEVCSDCRSVLMYREPEPPSRPAFPAFTREEQLEGRRLYAQGFRDELTVARNRSYERARKRERGKS